MMIGELSGKIAFITGAASGIGLGMARAFAGVGMKVAMADIDANALQAAATELERSGAKVLAVPLDVADWPSWAAAADKVTAALNGPVQVLCNNAGVTTMGVKFEALTPALWAKVVNINLNGVYYGIQCFLPQMRTAGGGHIVNTASFAGLFGATPTLSGYTTTKFAVVGLSESLHAEFAPYNIGVSVMCPASVRSKLWRTSRRIRDLPDIQDPPPETALGGSASPDGLDPFHVGQRVVDAVRAGELYIITHPEYRPALTHRHDQLMTAFDRAEAARDVLRPSSK
jgi:NAD(P)-dependent dehydrogenase (short-subunit alcohol dehydrogenase family)